MLGEQGAEVVGAPPVLRRAADGDQLDRLGVGGQRPADLVEQAVVDDHGAGVGVGQQVGVVVGLVQRVERDGHDAGADRAEEGGGERRGVVQDQQHPLLALDAQGAQRAPGGAGVGQQPLVGDLVVAAAHGDVAAPPGLQVAVEQGRGVVAQRQLGDRVGNRWERHRRPPGQCLTTTDLVSW